MNDVTWTMRPVKMTPPRSGFAAPEFIHGHEAFGMLVFKRVPQAEIQQRSAGEHAGELSQRSLFQVKSGEGQAEPVQIVADHRNGETMFQSADPTAGWDGYHQGKQQPIGAYIFYSEYYDFILKQSFTRKGTFTLLR